MFTRFCRKAIIGVIGLALTGVGYSPALASEYAGTKAMDFSKLAGSAKAESLGYALTAYSSLNGLEYNPAGIAQLDTPELLLQTQAYVESIQTQKVELAWPLPLGVVGLSYHSVDFGSQARTTWLNRDGTGELFSAVGSSVLGAYALRMNDISGGVGVRYYQETLDNNRSTAWGMDVGLAADLAPDWRVGASVINIPLRASTHVSQSDTLAYTGRVGVYHRITVWDRPLGISTDVVWPSDDDMAVGIGLEYALLPMLNVRAGYTSEPDLYHWAFGVGMRIDRWQMDVAYVPMSFAMSAYKIGVGVML
ncbi:MAG: hypothetical protein AAB066_03305 [Candidatus Margulisiibacteriota bacterium]